jgi:hypothetical protein
MMHGIVRNPFQNIAVRDSDACRIERVRSDLSGVRQPQQQARTPLRSTLRPS